MLIHKNARGHTCARAHTHTSMFTALLIIHFTRLELLGNNTTPTTPLIALTDKWEWLLQ